MSVSLQLSIPPALTSSVCTSSCSQECQREHWVSGHKTDCATFKDPPLAKYFSSDNRLGTDSPENPIFSRANKDGIGIWITTNGAVNVSLDGAFIPADSPITRCPYSPPPSFSRWASTGRAGRVDKDGTILMSLRIAVQNRRRNGTVVAVMASDIMLEASSAIKGFFDGEHSALMDIRKAGKEFEPMSVAPWRDYNDPLRVAILEINGVSSPSGTFNREYRRAQQPRGSPWERVLDWDNSVVCLAPGDYAVIGLQYRVGDGWHWKTYPELLYASTGLSVPFINSGIKVSSPLWADQMRTQYTAHRNSASQDSSRLDIWRGWDYDYLDEYFRLWLEGDDVEFMRLRYGRRATAIDEYMENTFNKILSLNPKQLAEFAKVAGKLKHGG